MGLGLAPAPSQRGQCHKITRGAIPDGKGLCRAAPRHKTPQKGLCPLLLPPPAPLSIIPREKAQREERRISSRSSRRGGGGGFG